MNDSARPVHVAMTSEVFYPNVPGGLLQFFGYAPGLKERGIHIHVHTKLEPEHSETTLEINGIRITRHSLPPAISHHEERRLLLGFACRDMDQRRSGGNVCVQPNGMTWSAAFSMWAARMKGISFIFYFSMFPEEPPSGKVKRMRHWCRLKAIFSPFARFIVCSERMKVAFQRIAGLPASRIEILPNGVDLDKFSPSEPAVKRELRHLLGISESAEIVLYSGSVTRRKGIDLLLAAWPLVLAERPGARLLLAGSIGPRKSFRDPGMRADLDAFTEEIYHTLDAMPGRDSVIMLGNCDQIADYYRAADLFVFPSRLEGLPNAVLEAMASGLPSVIAPFAGIPDDGEEFGTSGREFVRTTHVPSDIANAIIDLLVHPARRTAIGRAARDWMVSHQSLDHTLDQLSAIYRRSATGERDS